MSRDIRLGPVSYLVLGITALRGPSTPYDLKRFVQLSIGHFWPFPHTQLYAEPARLAEAGLLKETREESGRRRRHYELTAAGRERLDGWLVEPVASPNEIRDLALLKLFFTELADRDAVEALAAEQVAAHRAKAAIYQAIVDRFADRTADRLEREDPAFFAAIAAGYEALAAAEPDRIVVIDAAQSPEAVLADALAAL